MEEKICIDKSVLIDVSHRLHQLLEIESSIGWKELNKLVPNLDLSDGSMDIIDNLETNLNNAIKNGPRCKNKE